MNIHETWMKSKKIASNWWNKVLIYGKRHRFTLGGIIGIIILLLIENFYPLILSIFSSKIHVTPEFNISGIHFNGYVSISMKTIFFAIVGLFITSLIDKYWREWNIKKKHFPKSYRIINKEIPKNFDEKAIMGNYINDNNKIDRIIKSPLEYANETLKGNQAPVFKPNDSYLEEMYDDDVKLIIAITAENPNLWLDPTICFYLINCCAVSILRNTNNDGTKKIEIDDFCDEDTYGKYIKRNVLLLEKLAKHNWDWSSLSNFNFIRFFLFDEDQNNCLQNTVFPSLKSSQDLFRIKSFFLQKERIKQYLEKPEINHYNEYISKVDFIWDEIAKKNTTCPLFKKEIERRKKEHIPEFLILFKEVSGSKRVCIHTYVNGIPYKWEETENIDSHRSGYRMVQSLVTYLAEYRKSKDHCDWQPSSEFLNTKKSYIKWGGETISTLT